MSIETEVRKIVEEASGAGNRIKRTAWAELERLFGITQTRITEPDATADGDEETEEDLTTLTVAELRSYAEAHEIDLGDATKKADILATIEAASTADGDEETEED